MLFAKNAKLVLRVRPSTISGTKNDRDKIFFLFNTFNKYKKISKKKLLKNVNPNVLYAFKHAKNRFYSQKMRMGLLVLRLIFKELITIIFKFLLDKLRYLKNTFFFIEIHHAIIFLIYN